MEPDRILRAAMMPRGLLRGAAREESKGESPPWSQGGVSCPAREREAGRPGLPGARWKGETRSGFPLQIDFRGHDTLSLTVFNGIVLWGAADQTGTGYRVPLAFESNIRSGIEPYQRHRDHSFR
jgi:hypothetical protein